MQYFLLILIHWFVLSTLWISGPTVFTNTRSYSTFILLVHHSLNQALCKKSRNFSVFQLFVFEPDTTFLLLNEGTSLFFFDSNSLPPPAVPVIELKNSLKFSSLFQFVGYLKVFFHFFLTRLNLLVIQWGEETSPSFRWFLFIYSPYSACYRAQWWTKGTDIEFWRIQQVLW